MLVDCVVNRFKFKQQIHTHTINIIIFEVLLGILDIHLCWGFSRGFYIAMRLKSKSYVRVTALPKKFIAKFIW